MLANGVKETTATTGTGTVTLAAATGFVRFSQAFAVGAIVSYAIRDGNDWEWGIGTVGASNTLARDVCTAKIASGTFERNPATKLSLSGSAEVICTPHEGSQAETGAIGMRRQTSFLAPLSSYGGADITTAGTTASRVVAHPFRVPRPIKIDRLGTICTASASGSSVDVGIYDTVLASGVFMPGNLLLSVTGLDTTSTGEKTGTVDFTLLPGRLYFGAIRAEGGTPVLSGISRYMMTMGPVLGRDPGMSYATFTNLFVNGLSSLPAVLHSAGSVWTDALNVPIAFVREAA